MKAQGGKPIYGANVGILMTQAQFPRIPGDMGNADTWPFPVRYRIVGGASPDRVVRHRAEGLLPECIAAAKELVDEGAEVITTNCGFLVLYQETLAASLSVPVATSSLMQAAAIQALLPAGQQVGIITIDRSSLSADHLELAGVPEGTPIVGTEGGEEFSRVILADEPEMDVEAAKRDILRAGKQLTEEYSNVGAILLECTNMSPYSKALKREFGLPVFDIYSFVRWLAISCNPMGFPPAS